jgi:hypothetical protein
MADPKAGEVTTSQFGTLNKADLDLVVEFAGCSLDEKPGSNWV